MIPTTIRLPDDLRQRIDCQRVRFEAEHDVRMSFADAVRTLLDVALVGEEELEAAREDEEMV